jgi:hypothetical protein
VHALSIDAPAADRTREIRRVDVTDVEATQLVEYAAAREELFFERRGGVTYLVEHR